MAQAIFKATRPQISLHPSFVRKTGKTNLVDKTPRHPIAATQKNPLYAASFENTAWRPRLVLSFCVMFLIAKSPFDRSPRGASTPPPRDDWTPIESRRSGFSLTDYGPPDLQAPMTSLLPCGAKPPTGIYQSGWPISTMKFEGIPRFLLAISNFQCGVISAVACVFRKYRLAEMLDELTTVGRKEISPALRKLSKLPSMDSTIGLQRTRESRWLTAKPLRNSQVANQGAFE